MYASQLDLPEQVRKQAAALLQARLSDCLDLEAQLKQAHWTVRGIQFYQLHKLFDALHDEAEEYVDIIAERISAIGGVPDGRIQTTAEKTSLYPYGLGTRWGAEHLRAIAASLSELGKLLRADIDKAGEIGDADTADVFTEVSRGIDKQLWFVEAHLVESRG
jgi:starvation-inducible DNA-binding protein